MTRNLGEFNQMMNEIEKFQKQIQPIQKSLKIGRFKRWGKYVKVNGIMIALDCWIPEAEVCFISHAHMDHIPTLPSYMSNNSRQQEQKTKFICTKITKEVAELRTKGKFTFPIKNWLLGSRPELPQSCEYKGVKFSIFDNGHVPGSVALLIEDRESVFFTADFISENRVNKNKDEFTRGLKPNKCDYLITECTYGAPYYNFPSFRELEIELNKYIREMLDEDKLIIIACISFGKAQRILSLLDPGFDIILEKNIASITRVLEQNGLRFPEWSPYKKYNKNILKKDRKHVLLIPTFSINQSPYNELISKNTRIISASGRVYLDWFNNQIQADKYLPISDHADFDDLVSTILNCNPKIIFLEHGEIEKLSYFLSHLKEIRLLKVYSL